jgi:D-alanyl-D-alanine carboxypeptidase
MKFLGFLLCFALAPCAVVLAEPDSAPDPVRAADRLLRSHDFSGVVLITRNGEILFNRAYGKANIEADVDIRLDTPFRIASITKLFTAVAVARLVEAGKLDYDATIHTYLPSYTGEGGPSVTLRQLLTHTSGIANSDTIGSFDEAVTQGMPLYQLPATAAQIVQRHASGKLVSPPGSTFEYNNADYFILGRIIEQVTGQTYPAALKRWVLDPAALENTGMMNWRSLTPVVATGYLRFERTAPYIHELPAYHENWGAAGGLYATATDIARFSDALFGGDLLSADSLAQLLTVAKDEYAHGLWIAPVTSAGRPDRVAHRPGQIMGANTMLLRYLEDGLTVVMLSNTTTTPMDETAFQLARDFARQKEEGGG